MDLQQGIESTQRCLRKQIRRGKESRNVAIQKPLGERADSRGHCHSKSVQMQENENERNHPFYSFLGKQGTSSDCRSNSKEKPLATSRPKIIKRKLINFAKA